MEERATVLFLSAIMHRKSHTCRFCHFFLPCLQCHKLLRSRNFATLSTWCNDFSSVLIFFFPLTFFFIASKTEGFSWSTRLHWLQVLYEYQGISSCIRWSCRITGVWESSTLQLRFAQLHTGYSKGGGQGSGGPCLYGECPNLLLNMHVTYIKTFHDILFCVVSWRTNNDNNILTCYFLLKSSSHHSWHDNIRGFWK